MDILEALAIEMPCMACGSRYEVALEQIVLSPDMLHEGCPVTSQTECPPLAYADVVDRKLIEELQGTWARIEEAASAPRSQSRHAREPG